MQNQRKVGEWPGVQEDAEVTVKPLSVQTPDVHESMRLAGIKDAQKPSEPRRRLICCCGAPGCRIGPMTIVVEEPGVEY